MKPAVINKLYQEVLLEQNRAPHHCAVPASYCAQGKAYNPTCGDDLDVFIVSLTPLLHGVYFSGEACAVSTASASLMTRVLEGMSAGKALQACVSFIRAIEEGVVLSGDQRFMKELQPLLAVREFPGRHGCATLPWRAMQQILQANTQLAESA